MSQQFTRKQVSEQSGPKRTLFVIDNVVYDATPFLDEHPGGHEVLVNVAGKDASEEFDDIGHSLDAKELMRKYVAGELVEADRVAVTRRAPAWGGDKAATEGDDQGLLASWKLPLLLALAATVLYTYLFA